MGRIDKHTKSYLNDNRRFADMINGSLRLKDSVRPEELVETNTNFIYTGAGISKEIFADVAKLWKRRNVVFALFTIENLDYVDYTIVIRCMLTEAMAYHNQWKQLKGRHKGEKGLSKDEFLSGVRKDDVFYPVIPVVVYYGTERKWDAETSLHGFLGDALSEELKNYVNDYKMNLFDFHKYNSFEQFETDDLKVLFEMLRYANDKKALAEVMEQHADRYSSVDMETGQVLKELSHNRALEKIPQKPEGGRVNMFMAFEEYRLEGERKGRLEGRITLIRKKLDKGMETDEIAELLEMELSDVEEIAGLLAEYPEEDDSFIAEKILSKAAV